MIPRWGVEYRLASNPNDRRSFERPAGVVLDQLGLTKRSMRIEVFPEVPRSMGLGGSAAMAVAIVRAPHAQGIEGGIDRERSTHHPIIAAEVPTPSVRAHWVRPRTVRLHLGRPETR